MAQLTLPTPAVELSGSRTAGRGHTQAALGCLVGRDNVRDKQDDNDNDNDDDDDLLLPDNNNDFDNVYSLSSYRLCCGLRSTVHGLRFTGCGPLVGPMR